MHLRRRPPSETAVVEDTIRSAETRQSATLADALAMIDRSLVNTADRHIVTSDEVSDLLLDLRVVLLEAELDAIGLATAATD